MTSYGGYDESQPLLSTMPDVERTTLDGSGSIGSYLNRRSPAELRRDRLRRIAIHNDSLRTNLHYAWFQRSEYEYGLRLTLKVVKSYWKTPQEVSGQ